MSEYQYFEFRAIDRPLDEQAQRELRGISSRASITATNFTNTYSWGDLKADPAKMLARWFDASLHVTNWGTQWLAFRVPLNAIAADGLAPHEGELFSAQRHGEHLCLHFRMENDEPGDRVDGEVGHGALQGPDDRADPPGDARGAPERRMREQRLPRSSWGLRPGLSVDRNRPRPRTRSRGAGHPRSATHSVTPPPRIRPFQGLHGSRNPL